MWDGVFRLPGRENRGKVPPHIALGQSRLPGGWVDGRSPRAHDSPHGPKPHQQCLEFPSRTLIVVRYDLTEDHPDEMRAGGAHQPPEDLLHQLPQVSRPYQSSQHPMHEPWHHQWPEMGQEARHDGTEAVALEFPGGGGRAALVRRGAISRYRPRLS